jgi:radical SAM family uncharacterized protein
LTELDDILFRVSRPARYTGGEWNSITKDWDETPIRIALAYPDLYEVGMSNLGLSIIYELLNAPPDVLAERFFAPWPDMEAQLRTRNIPLFSLESKRPLGDFDAIGFSLGYELTYTNVLNTLDLARIPVFAAERDDSFPLVMAGGSSVLNPEPMADFIDFFIIGEGEEASQEIIELLRKRKSHHHPKQELLRQLATLPGIYVPSLYHVEYDKHGRFKSITPTAPEAKPQITRRVASQLPPCSTRPVVPFIEVIHDRGAVEIQRGCSRGCRFCQAGNIYRPPRERAPEEIIQAVGEMITNCGYNEFSLTSLSSCDYPGIDELVESIFHRYRDQNLILSLPSLRIDSFSVGLLKTLARHKRTGLTFAPEAGSERLRRVINKAIPEEKILETAAEAFAHGWNGLKLYFMLGLPTETTEDVAAIVSLVNRISDQGRQNGGRRPQIRLSLSTFVPQPHTPFQWTAQEAESIISAKHEILKEGLRRRQVRLSWDDPKVSQLEAAISRGDRRLGRVIHRAWKAGSTFDSWSERFNYENWLNAFKESGLDPDFYARRERPLDEPLPWAHIDTGVTQGFLKREYARALAGEETPDCRTDKCSGCGLQRWLTPCRQKCEGPTTPDRPESSRSPD